MAEWKKKTSMPTQVGKATLAHKASITTNLNLIGTEQVKIDIAILADSTPNSTESMSIGGVEYHSGDSVYLSPGTFLVQWISHGTGVLAYWSATANLTVASPYTSDTNITAAGAGTLTLNLAWGPTFGSGSLVGTSTSSIACYAPFQRKSFYANGLFWVFYSDGTNLVYKTSEDATVWSALNTVRACNPGNYFSLVFDGTYLHYILRYEWDLFYRRGTPNADGTITWSAVEQTLFSGTSSNYHREPTIAVDSLGYVWVGTDERIGSSYYPWAWKNANKDGTWANATGFPYKLNANSSDWRTIVVPLTSGKVYFVYPSTYSPYICGRLYDGSWQSEDTNFTEYLPEPDGTDDCSAVAISDTVYFVYVRKTTYQIRMCQRTSSWQPEELVQASVTQYCGPVLCAGAYFVCIWGATDNHIYYKRRINGVWDASPFDWIDESSEHLALNGVNIITCFYQPLDWKIGIVYTTKTGSPYNVKFSY